MFFFKRKITIQTERLTLRLPQLSDYRSWSGLRSMSKDYLTPWEPTWAPDHLTRRSFYSRVSWAQKELQSTSGIPLFMIDRQSNQLVGAITLSNIRRGPNQTATIGYWVGQSYARQGYASEAVSGLVHYAFEILDLSRIESACLPENAPSRGVLEKVGFKYEGVAQSYIQINGRWRTHVLYARLRADRRGQTDIGVA